MGTLIQLLQKGLQFSGENETWSANCRMSAVPKPDGTCDLQHQLELRYLGRECLETLIFSLMSERASLRKEVAASSLDQDEFRLFARIQTLPPQHRTDLPHRVLVQWNGHENSIDLTEQAS